MAQPVPLGKPLTQSKPEPPATPAAAPIRNRLVAANLSYQIDFSPQLQGAIDDWLTWKREDFIEALENFAHLQPKLAPIYAEAGLPEALLFGMAAKESLGRAHSYSPAGAVGLLQFMPATASAMVCACKTAWTCALTHKPPLAPMRSTFVIN